MKQHGFTLIELMIVVAVVAILATIALPSYNDAVRKSRRGQAKADMVDLAQRLERYHSQFNTYVNFPGAAGTFPSPASTSGTARYNIAVGNLAVNSFTLTAAPISGTGQEKDRCGSLSITHTGQKAATGGTAEECF